MVQLTGGFRQTAGIVGNHVAGIHGEVFGRRVRAPAFRMLRSEMQPTITGEATAANTIQHPWSDREWSITGSREALGRSLRMGLVSTPTKF